MTFLEPKTAASASAHALARAAESLAGGVGSAARLRHQPFFVSHGRGARIWDLDGNEYIDYVLAYGPLVLGHAPEVVRRAVADQLTRGTMFGAGFQAEYLLAEEVVRALPCADLVRFANSGTEALHFVLRLARAFTGRNKVIRFEGHYHGWLDESHVSVAPSPAPGPDSAPLPALDLLGQPSKSADDLIILPWNDLAAVEQALESYRGRVAALICEPVPFYHGPMPPQPGFLEGLRELTRAHGVVLIFDEVVTGFRLALGGAQEFFGVTPDLCAFAKGFAAGLPMAGFGGRAEIMDLVATNKVPHMGTYNTNPLSVVGALAAIRELAKDDAKAIRTMAELGGRLKEGLNRLFGQSGRPLEAIGYDPIFTVVAPGYEPRNYRDTLTYNFGLMTAFHQAMFRQGIWFMGRGTFMVSAAHTEEDIQATLDAAQAALGEL